MQQVAANLIQKASIHQGCSTGQYHLGMFVKSCLNYEDKVNMKEVLYQVGINEVTAILELSDSDGLRELVQSINPSLLEKD